VLTAHPTEVQRKSILDAERAIAELVGERDDWHRAPSAPTTRRCCAPASRSSGRRACCAPRKLTVATRSRTRSATTTTFLREIPRLYREIEQALPGHAVAPFLRMGHWIGGDRDGNPNVTAATLRDALRARARWRCAST
jgi:phosphoenolpyruvate carboxylase